MASSVTEPRPSDSSPAAGAVAGPGEPTPPGQRRKGLSEKNRPLWLLIPGGLLMTIVILVPLAMGIWMSLIDLDQYTLRQWVSSEFIGIKNYIEAAVSSDLLRSIWLSVSFAVISTVVTVPLGVAAAVVTQNAYRGRAVVRSIFLI
ncbi:MAG TPA: sugar ABC transporter permease, partial [Arthrobacter sp.]|nr:sugar ABC transporter permease [Arthrobacter sp.]